MDDLYRQKFAVPYEYTVSFTRNVFAENNDTLPGLLPRHEGPARIVVYVDSGVYESRKSLPDEIEKFFSRHQDSLVLARKPVVVPGGENCKNGWEGVRRIIAELGDLRLCRQSYVMVIGGGSLLDSVGFAASLVHRGVRLIRLPTTVLAQNDAGVGVKNGMNEHGMKNFVGTFSPPFAVINDVEFLKTLPDVDWRAGISEAFKVAIIKDRVFLEYLCANARALKERDVDLMEELVRRCAVLHLQHIGRSGDPFEFGSARPLDFGHWAAHKLEVMSGFSICHGYSVAAGIAVDSCYAAVKGLISDDDRDLILSGLADSGLPVWTEFLNRRDSHGALEVMSGIEEFREHLGGRLCVTMPSPLGSTVEIHEMDQSAVEESIAYLAAHAGRESR